MAPEHNLVASSCQIAAFDHVSLVALPLSVKCTMYGLHSLFRLKPSVSWYSC